MEKEFKYYERKGLSLMRPYVFGEDMSGISVSPADDPETDMGMVAINEKNPKDQWYVARKYFEENLKLVEDPCFDYTAKVKTLHNSDVSGARKNVKDIRVVGNGDMFRLLCKASSENEGWMKSTKAMNVTGGVVVQVTTQQKNPDGSYAVAEALTYVPGNHVVSDVNNGRKIE